MVYIENNKFHPALDLNEAVKYIIQQYTSWNIETNPKTADGHMCFIFSPKK